MINLVAPDEKKQLRAARHNHTLANYLTIFFLSVLVLVGVFGVGFYITLAETEAAVAQKAQNDQSAQTFANTRKAADDFAKDLLVAKTILESDVRFSQLISDIAAVIPSGVILSNLTFTSQAGDAPLTINAKAKSYDGTITLKNSLETSPIFENVQIISATTSAGQDAEADDYPINISVSVQFSPSGGDAQ